jgi:hypothetical protein
MTPLEAVQRLVEAARQTGLSPHGVCDAVLRVRRADALISQSMRRAISSTDSR